MIDFNTMSTFIEFAFFGIFGIVIFMFVFVFINMFSSKSRAKMMSKQVKAMKHMVDYTKEDLQDLMTDLGEVSVNVQNNIINQNEDVLKNIANKTADISKEAIETTVGAVRNGWNADKVSKQFCKYCGKKIDSDSRFCNYCGNKQ